MTPDCKWASSTSAVSPPLFCRRSLSLFKTPTAQTVPSSDLLPPWLTLPSPRCRLPSAPSPHPGGEPGPQPGRSLLLAGVRPSTRAPPAFSSLLLYCITSTGKNIRKTRTPSRLSSWNHHLPSLFLEAAKACALLGVLNLLLLSGKLLPLPPAWGASLPFRSHRRCHLLREVLCYRVMCHLR